MILSKSPLCTTIVALAITYPLLSFNHALLKWIT
jgi:hypothetical protein